MLNFFKPKLPIELNNKAWIEYRWRWLGENVGWDLLRNTVPLTLVDFPELENLTVESARRTFDRIAKQYRISSSTVSLNFVEDDQLPKSACGLYRPATSDRLAAILIAKSLFHHPPSVVTTIAHELAHHLLLGGATPLHADDESDHEPLTDLVLIYAGLGLFVANCTILEYSDGAMQSSGYMTSKESGYALGLMAWHKGELSPPWLGQLRADAKEPCGKAIQYLTKTQDALVQPDVYLSRAERLRAAKETRSLSPTGRLAQIWEWQHEQAPLDSIVADLTLLLADPVREIRIGALTLFRDLRAPLNRNSEQTVLTSMSSKNSTESLLACDVLQQNKFDDQEILLWQSHRWFKSSAETMPARTTFCWLLSNIDANLFLPKYQKTLVAKVDRDLRTDVKDARDLLEALRLVPNIEAILNSFFNHWSAERQQDVVEFRDTGVRPIQR